MPELPEVEVVVRQLDAAVRGRRLGALRVLHPDVFLATAGLRPADVAGKTVTVVRRRAKLVVLDLSGGLLLTVHLRMTGRLWLAAAADPLPEHTHCCLGVGRGRELRFRDPRRFGRWHLLRAGELAELPFVRRLGPEPFDLARDALAERLSWRTGSLKGALLDQSLVAGLGNIYVDEILFRAGLHPRLVANRLRPQELDRLHESMLAVLDAAIEAGGSTIRDYLPLTGTPGRFQRSHQVFGRGGASCRVCGRTIRKLRVAGRGTHFCPGCQPARRRRPRPRGARAC
jgi:formamidopyrimidine-DNA glycosylase